MILPNTCVTFLLLKFTNLSRVTERVLCLEKYISEISINIFKLYDHYKCESFNSITIIVVNMHWMPSTTLSTLNVLF